MKRGTVLIGCVSLLAALGCASLHGPQTNTFSDLIKRFHGKVAPTTPYPGEDPAEVKLLRAGFTRYVFTAPKKDVKGALLNRLHAGGWKIVDFGGAFGTMSFRRDRRREFGFFDEDKRLFPRDAKGTTCVLTLQKSKKTK